MTSGNAVGGKRLNRRGLFRRNSVTKPDHTVKKNEVPSLCYECRGPGHHWCDCPQCKPPTETPGWSRTSQKATSSAVTSATLSETLEHLRKLQVVEWATHIAPRLANPDFSKLWTDASGKCLGVVLQLSNHIFASLPCWSMSNGTE